MQVDKYAVRVSLCDQKVSLLRLSHFLIRHTKQSLLFLHSDIRRSTDCSESFCLHLMDHLLLQ